MIQSEDVENTLHYLLFNKDNEEEAKQVHVSDEGSKPQFVRVFKVYLGVVDTGADITISNGPMFKWVAANNCVQLYIPT